MSHDFKPCKECPNDLLCSDLGKCCDPKAWSATVTEVGIEVVKSLQSWIQANPQSLMFGLAGFFMEHRMEPRWNEALTFWGEMAERIYKGEDIVGNMERAAK